VQVSYLHIVLVDGIISKAKEKKGQDELNVTRPNLLASDASKRIANALAILARAPKTNRPSLCI
jgi:hypothetical protein